MIFLLTHNYVYYYRLRNHSFSKKSRQKIKIMWALISSLYSIKRNELSQHSIFSSIKNPISKKFYYLQIWTSMFVLGTIGCKIFVIFGKIEFFKLNIGHTDVQQPNWPLSFPVNQFPIWVQQQKFSIICSFYWNT